MLKRSAKVEGRAKNAEGIGYDATVRNAFEPLYPALLITECDLPVGLSPRPFPTSPLFLRSICQLSVSPALFFNVKAKTACPCLTASLRSASDAVRASLIASKASEEGNAPAECQRPSSR